MHGFRSMILGGALALATAGGAQAAVIPFFDIDNGVGIGGPYTNSLLSASLFLGGAGPVDLLTFEGLAPGAVASFSPATGVTLSRTGDDYGPGYTGVSNTQFGTNVFGFNITPGGDTWFGAPNGTMTFSFDVPVTAWGGFMTGMQNSLGGDIVVSFDNGAPQVFNLSSGAAGGVQFFGVVSDTGFSSITLTKLTGGDAWGIDDVYYSQQTATPEPASAALLAAGLIGLAARRRRAA